MIDLEKEFTKIIKVALQNMIRTEFATESDYNGKKWLPKKVPNGKPTLIDTGALRLGFKFDVSSSNVALTNKVSYFNNATGNNKVRPVIPETTLPTNVKKEVQANIKKFLDKNFKSMVNRSK
jgi:hypothetical protein